MNRRNNKFLKIYEIKENNGDFVRNAHKSTYVDGEKNESEGWLVLHNNMKRQVLAYCHSS